MVYPLARSSDPQSSHLANKAIAENKTLAEWVLIAVRDITFCIGVTCATDDQILEYIENATHKRQQRNVIARARGILERDSKLMRVQSEPRVGVRLFVKPYSPKDAA
jgi:hypothetical protein